MNGSQGSASNREIVFCTLKPRSLTSIQSPMNIKENISHDGDEILKKLKKKP